MYRTMEHCYDADVKLCGKLLNLEGGYKACPCTWNAAKKLQLGTAVTIEDEASQVT
jgi:hypothetical protein